MELISKQFTNEGVESHGNFMADFKRKNSGYKK